MKKRAKPDTRNFLVSRFHPTYRLNTVVVGKKQRDRLIASQKKMYPTIPMYWIQVNEG